MKFSLGASLAAMLCLLAGPALAGSAVLSNDMTAFEGPGDNYAPVLHLVAGQRIDILECNFKQWCQIEHGGKLGWVHASLAAPKAGSAAGNGETPGSGGGTASGGGGSKDGGSKPTFSKVGGEITQTGDGGGTSGGGKMPKFSKVGGEITQTGDGGGSSGGSGGSGGGTTARDRASAGGGGGSSSSEPASAATHTAPPADAAAPAAPCRGC